MNINEKLGHGTTFYVEKLIPHCVWDEEDNERYCRRYWHGDVECAFRSCPYCAGVFMSQSTHELIFKIWDTEESSRIEIDGYDTFVFDIRPHTEFKEGDEKGYDYRPQKGYGLYDYEKYDGCSLYPTIKCLIVDLIESSLKSNNDDEV